jgi:hypothetical protein
LAGGLITAGQGGGPAHPASRPGRIAVDQAPGGIQGEIALARARDYRDTRAAA